MQPLDLALPDTQPRDAKLPHLSTPQNMHNLASPHQASPLSEDVVVPGGEVNQMTQVVTIKPFDVVGEITPKRRNLDFCLLAGASIVSLIEFSIKSIIDIYIFIN